MGTQILSLNALCQESHKTSKTVPYEPGYKTLLLGCGHVGKSTIFKQLKLLYDGGFKHDDYASQGKYIQDAVVNQMKNILWTLQDPETNEFKTIDTNIMQAAQNIVDLSPEQPLSSVADYIETLWANQTIKNAYKQKGHLGIADSAEYFFDNLESIKKPDYRPTDRDIILSYIPTTGIRNKTFDVNGCKLDVYDTGGQRSERNKWIHCFDGVTCMIYVASLNHFDTFLFEENEISAMHESIECFECLVNTKYFRNTQMVLILNFNDLFKDKIENQNKSISACFNDYDDNKSEETDDTNEYERSLEFIKDKFRSKMPANQELYVHVMCAIDAEDIKKVFSDIAHFMTLSIYSPKKFKTVYDNLRLEHDDQKYPINEIKLHFPLILVVYIAMCCILIFVPYYALSYLQMAMVGITILLIWAVGIQFVFEGEVSLSMPKCTDREDICAAFVIILIHVMGILHSIQVSYFQLHNETKDDFKWIVYLFFPICAICIYFIMISFTTYYWYWHQSWIVFWYGIILLIIGFMRDTGVQYVNDALWIIGIFLIVLSSVFPFIAYYYFKQKQKSTIYHKLNAVNVELNEI